MPKFTKTPINHIIPVQLTEKQFNKFILKHLSISSRGPDCSIPPYKVFNYTLKIIHPGMQWHQLPIDKNADGNHEIHYTRIFKIYK